MKLNTKGFSAVEGLLILIIVGIIGFAGWKVWDASRIRNNSESQGASVQQVSTQQNNDAHEETTNNYLKVPELGLKIALSEDINDAYIYKSNEGWYYMSVRSMDGAEGFEGCRAGLFGGTEYYGIAAIESLRVGDDYYGSIIDEEFLSKLDTFEKDGTHYRVIPGNGPCMDVDKIQQDNPQMIQFGKVREAFIEAKLSSI